jgi:hypothetical protein
MIVLDLAASIRGLPRFNEGAARKLGGRMGGMEFP